MASRSGGRSGVEVVGLKEFRARLKSIDGEWDKELRKIHKEIADVGVARAQAMARGGTRQQAASAKAIRGRATQREARIAVLANKSSPFANAAFYGAKRRTGWYGFRRYLGHEGKSQFKPWVGNSWEVARFGQGPYALNPALAKYLPEIIDLYVEMLEHLFHRAFPEGR